MGLSDTKQKQQQNFNNASTTSWGQITPEDTPDIQKLRGETFKVDPGLSYQYANQKNQLKSGFQNPTGAYYSPQVRDAIIRSGQERLGQQESQDMREGQHDVNALNFARDQSVADMTAPKIVQTGGTSSGTGTVVQTQSQSPWGTIMQGVGMGAQMSL